MLKQLQKNIQLKFQFEYYFKKHGRRQPDFLLCKSVQKGKWGLNLGSSPVRRGKYTKMYRINFLTFYLNKDNHRTKLTHNFFLQSGFQVHLVPKNTSYIYKLKIKNRFYNWEPVGPHLFFTYNKK